MKWSKTLLGSLWVQRMLSYIFAMVTWLLHRSIRWRYQHAVPLQELTMQEGPVIVAFWHGRLLMMPQFWSRRRYGVAYAMISRHRDGTFIARICKRFGMEVIHGSTGKGGVSAARRAVDVLQRGEHIIMTPDGPRGPHEQVSRGLILLAKQSGRPILPAAYSAKRCIRIRSWDSFMVPWPFARGALVTGPLMWLADDMTEEEALSRVQRALDDVTSEADHIVGNR